jgi:predicted phage terminase large subunit-like protein
VAGTGKDRILVAGHRVHEDDLFAHVWETFGNDGSWTYLVLPEEARPTYTNSFHNGTGWKDTRAEGELLAPERFDEEWLATQKRQLRHKYNCVYQQDTTPRKGQRFDSAWFQHYTEDQHGEDGYYVCGERRLPKGKAWRFATCDTAISTASGADYTVMQVWDVIGDYCVLVDQLRKKLDGTKIIPTLAEFYRRHRPQFVTVEEEFIGKFVIDQLREQGLTVRRFSSKGHGDKETRAIAAEIRLEAKKVWFPASAEWVGDLEAELLAFPHGAHDDQVDAMSQACITADRYRGRVEPDLTPEQKAEKQEKQKQAKFNAMLNAGCPF